jgi:hypothetical protein
VTTASRIKSWRGPSPSDKYLPIWVVAIMFAAVWVLSAQMTSVIKDVCKIENRCYAATAVRENSTVAEVVGSAVKKAAEMKVAEAIAAAASAAPAAPAASEIKTK